MPLKVDTRRLKQRVRRQSAVLVGALGLSAALLFFAAYYIDRLNFQRFHQQQRTETIAELSIIQAQIEGKLFTNIQTIQGLIAAISVEPEMDQARFEQYARPLLNPNTQLRNIGAAPDMVIRLIYPLEGNEAALGLNYLTHPTQREAAMNVQKNGQPVITGPVNLVQGGIGFIGRLPVFISNEKGEEQFWGLVSAVVDAQRFYEAAGLMKANPALDIAIRRKSDGESSDTVFYGTADIFSRQPQIMEIALPGGAWQIAATPRHGWSLSAPNKFLFRSSLLAIALILLAIIYAIGKLIQKRSYQQQLLQILFDHSPLGIALNDFHNGRFIKANQAAAESMGYSKEELLQLSYSDLTPNGPDNADKEQVKILKETGRYGPYENTFKRKDGSTYPVILSGIILDDDQGRKLIWSTIEDISLRKENENSLLKAKSEAEQAVKAKSEFLAMMSHEIRTPMNGVLGMINILRHSELDPESLRKLDIAHTSAESLLTIINDILDFSKIEAGKLEIENTEINLFDFLGDFIESMAVRAEEKGLELLLDTRELEYRTIYSDSARLLQLLNNLVGNAIKFTEKGEVLVRCTLKASQPDTRIVFEIVDTGIGIPEEKLDVLFTPFTQVDASMTRKYGGTGLGLAICKKICNSLNGDIVVTSQEGKGSCFRFELDIKRGQHRENNKTLLAGKNILLCDSNPCNLQLIQAYFARAGAYTFGFSSYNMLQRGLSKNKIKFDFAVLSENFDVEPIDCLHLIKHLATPHPKHIVFMERMTRLSQIDTEDHKAFDLYFPKPFIERDYQNCLALFMQPESKHSNQSQAIETHSRWREGARILLVEDNEVNQAVASMLLQELQIHVSIADDGVEALKKLKQETYDLVFMDCQMPNMDGYQTTREIRQGHAGNQNINIPIVAMTANAMKGDREKCLASGMDDYISKPIDDRNITRCLAQYLPTTLPNFSAR